MGHINEISVTMVSPAHGLLLSLFIYCIHKHCNVWKKKRTQLARFDFRLPERALDCSESRCLPPATDSSHRSSLSNEHCHRFHSWPLIGKVVLRSLFSKGAVFLWGLVILECTAFAKKVAFALIPCSWLVSKLLWKHAVVRYKASCQKWGLQRYFSLVTSFPSLTS